MHDTPEIYGLDQVRTAEPTPVTRYVLGLEEPTLKRLAADLAQREAAVSNLLSLDPNDDSVELVRGVVEALNAGVREKALNLLMEVLGDKSEQNVAKPAPEASHDGLSIHPVVHADQRPFSSIGVPLRISDEELDSSGGTTL